MASSKPTLRLQDLSLRNNVFTTELFAKVNIYFFYNARGALYHLARSLPAEKGNSILVPMFHCPTVIEPLIRAGKNIIFYKINLDLTINEEDFIKKLNQDVGAVVVINYFGFPAELSAIKKFKEQYGYYIIEDCAHSFLSGEELSGERGDMAIFSFSKLIPCYAGGAIRVNICDFLFQADQPCIAVSDSIIILKRLVEQLMNNNGPRFLRSLFHWVEGIRVSCKRTKDLPIPEMVPKVEVLYPFKEHLVLAKIPKVLKTILQGMDLMKVRSARRENFSILNDGLVNGSGLKKIYDDIPDSVVPWAYPILLNGRKKYEHILEEKGVPLFTFGETLHPLLYQLSTIEIKEAEFLSKNLLMIAIDQNISNQKTQSLVSEINEVLSMR